MRLAALLALSLVACGHDPVPGEDFACSRSARKGTYVYEWTSESGNCSDALDSWAAYNQDDTCVSTAADVWGDDECAATRVVRCFGPSFVAESTTTTVQQDADGGRLEGTLTLQVTGSSVCTETFRVVAERQ